MCHVGVDEKFGAAGDRQGVFKCHVEHGFWGLRQNISVYRDGWRELARRRIGWRRDGIENRTAAAAGVYAQVRILDLGIVIAATHREQQRIGEIGLKVHLEALSLRLGRVDQAVEVCTAADCGQLQIFYVKTKYIKAQTRPLIEQIGLHASFVRGDGF